MCVPVGLAQALGAALKGFVQAAAAAALGTAVVLGGFGTRSGLLWHSDVTVTLGDRSRSELQDPYAKVG